MWGHHMIWALALLGGFVFVFGPGYVCDAVLGRSHPISETMHCYGTSAFFSAIFGGVAAVIIGGMTPYWPVFWFFCVIPPLVVAVCLYRKLRNSDKGPVCCGADRC